MTITIMRSAMDTLTRITAELAPQALSRLLQLASPLLPVGAYAYSQGLEAAIEAGRVKDAATAGRWIGDTLALYLARFELPLLLRLHQAWNRGEDGARWNEFFLAGRETAEARAETLQMGYSLADLLARSEAVEEAALERLRRVQPVSFPLAFACVAAEWNIPASAALQAYGWSWAENQVSVAMKAIPIGQVAGQRLLLALGAALPAAVAMATALPDADLRNAAPGLALAQCDHETQYSRLFRS